MATAPPAFYVPKLCSLYVYSDHFPNSWGQYSYLGRREIKWQEVGENYIMRNFVVFNMGHAKTYYGVPENILRGT
jgi:hypothetical protein